MKHPNLTAYDGVEELSSFNESAFEEYCTCKLRECDKQVDFIRRIIDKKNYTGKVIEIGSGNGKLLYALEKNGLLDDGLGYELSSSRVNFAIKFSESMGSTRVQNICGDYLELDKSKENIDLIIGVDIVLQLIAPVSESSEKLLLDKVFSALKHGGNLIMELMDFTNIINMKAMVENDLMLWKEFDEHDPWHYGLDKFSINGDDVVWDKRFINRDRNIGDSTFTNVLRHYTFDIIKQKLIQTGFDEQKIHCFTCWKSEGDIPKDEFIVTAEK